MIQACRAIETYILMLLLPSAVLTVWDFTGQLPEWKHTFPDYDCYRSAPESDIDWNSLRERLSSATRDEWGIAIGSDLARISFKHVAATLSDWRKPDCAFGVLVLALYSFSECLLTVPECAEIGLLDEVIQGLIKGTQLELLLGTRWPVLSALGSLKFAPYIHDPKLNCEDLESPVLDWTRLRDAFLPENDWLRDGRHLVYDRNFQANWVQAMDECPHGFAMVSLWKLVVCAETQAECVGQYSVFVDDLLKNGDWREFVANKWPIFEFLSRVQSGIMRHKFHLDFLPSELNDSRMPAGSTPVLSSDDLSKYVDGGMMSESFRGVLRSVLSGAPKQYIAERFDRSGTEVRSLLYVSMVFGPRYVPYIPRFISRATALGLSNLVLFCLDDAALESCMSAQGGEDRCVRGTPSILNKFTFPLAYLQLGVDVFWLDFDVFLMQDPTSSVLSTASARQVDLLVSGSFADDCICSGLVFFRATTLVATWLLTVLSWMYEHTYTHDQQAFSAFLAGRPDLDNATTPERISSSNLFNRYLNPEVPTWALLDPVTEFVSARVLNTTGWTGDIDNMIIFHFLHGDSEVNRDHSAYGWNDRHGFRNTSAPLLDIFYNQIEDRVYSQPEGPHHLSAEIREAVMMSRRAERPHEMLHCGVLQLNPYSPGRMSPDG